MLELMKEIRELIKDKNHWTTKALARDGFGNIVDPNWRDAYCWCFAGAIIKIVKDSDLRVIIAREFQTDVNFKSLDHINDSCGHDEVIAAIDRTINRLEKLKDNGDVEE